MPVGQPFNIYREQLTSLHHGHALWEPNPREGTCERVSVGDVGYVREGYFCRMFNVTLAWDHPSNKKLCEPEPYKPLDCDPLADIRRSTFAKGDYHSRQVSTATQENASNIRATPHSKLVAALLRPFGNGKTLTVHSRGGVESVTYRCRSQGALLSLPYEGEDEDVIHPKVFEDYMRANVVNWFAWALKNGLGIERMEDLILVTGCTLATTWAAAAFVDPAVEAEISLLLFRRVDRGVNFKWNKTRSTVAHRNSRSGPTDPHRTTRDQCVFLRGFRAKRVVKTKLRAEADVPKYRDPLIGVLDYIAEKCPEDRLDDPIAIAHDDNLQLVKNVETLTADAVEKFLRENRIPVHVENGVATLGDSNSTVLRPQTANRQLQKEKHEHVPIKEPVTKRRVHFNEDPVAEVHSMQFPASSTSSLVSSSGSSTPSPLPDGAFPQRSDPSPQQQPQAPNSSPNPKPSVFVPVPPPSRVSDVSIHRALAAPSLSYDVRLLPSQYNPSLSPAILGAVASIPPLPYLSLRIDDLPWRFSVFPDAGLSRDRKGVTIQDVLVGVYHQLRVAVKSDEYEAMSKYKKAKIFQAFERRVGTDAVQRGAGLRRIDCLGGRHIAQGLIHAESQNRIWTVVVQGQDVPPNEARPSSSRSESEPTASMPGSMSAELEAWSLAIQQFLQR